MSNGHGEVAGQLPTDVVTPHLRTRVRQEEWDKRRLAQARPVQLPRTSSSDSGGGTY